MYISNSKITYYEQFTNKVFVVLNKKKLQLTLNNLVICQKLYFTN